MGIKFAQGTRIRLAIWIRIRLAIWIRKQILRKLLVSARHLYVVCIYGAIYLQIQKSFLQILLFFHHEVNINSTLLSPNLCKRFRGETARYYV
jgi:hypothetical protein